MKISLNLFLLILWSGMKMLANQKHLNDRVLMQANALTQARNDLTRDQLRIFIMCLDTVAASGWPEDGRFRIDHEEYMALYGVSEQEAREDIRRALTNFRGKELSIYESWDGVDEPVIQDISWITSRWRCEKRGIYQIKFNPDLRCYMEPLAYDIPFTAFKKEHAKKASVSRYSTMLLVSLSQFRDTGIFAVKIDTLHTRWNLPPSYKKYSLLYARVLAPAIAELKRIPEFADLSMEKRVDKQSKVTSVYFTFTKQERKVKR